MPRIRHWFHVSHDINADEEVWELTDQYGAWGLRVWLQILSIADRNAGYVKGDIDLLSRSMSRLWGSNSRRYNTGWRVNKARMIIEWMLNKHWIEYESASNQHRIDDGLAMFRVCNWLIYNPTREHKGNATDSLPPSPIPSPSPTPIKPPISPLKGEVVDISFEVFWKEYPKKAGKVSAIKAWKKEAGILKDIQEKIMEALPRHKSTEQWQKDGGRFVPHAATWLNQRRWEDEIEEVEDIYSKPGRTTEEILAELNARHQNGKR